MKKILSLLLLGALPALSYTFSAQTSEGSLGEIEIRGNATLEVTGLNWVRYHYRIKRAVTPIDAPDVLKVLPFLKAAVGPATESAEQARDAAKSAPAESAPAQDLANDIVAAASDAESMEADASLLSNELRAFLAASDKFFATSLNARGGDFLGRASSLQEKRWPATDGLRTRLDDSNLRNKTVYFEALDRIDEAKAEWEKARNQIALVAEHLRAAASAPQALKEEVRCSDGPRKIELSLLVFDLFPPDEADDEETEEADPVEKPMITFVCEHPLSLSTGVFFSLLDEKDFDFRSQYDGLDDDGNPTSSEVIGFRNRSSFFPLPGVLLNTRVWKRPGIDVHLSFGAVADFGDDEGADVEFIVGPSLGVKKHFLFTAGAHIGRVPELQGGFEIGTPKLEGLDAVPTQNSYKVGLAFGVSYRFNPE